MTGLVGPHSLSTTSSRVLQETLLFPHKRSFALSLSRSVLTYYGTQSCVHGKTPTEQKQKKIDLLDATAESIIEEEDDDEEETTVT